MSTGRPAVEGAGRTSALALLLLGVAVPRGGIATELRSGRRCVRLELPRGCVGRGSLCLGSQLGLAHRPEAVGYFPEAALCSDSPVTVETETPNRLFQCISPFPGRASPCHSPPPAPHGWGLQSGRLDCGEGQESQGVCLHVRDGGGCMEQGLTLKPRARGQRSLSA